MKAVLIISLLFICSIGFGQSGSITTEDKIHNEAMRQVLSNSIYIVPQGFQFKTSEYTEYKFHNAMMEPYTSKEFLIMERSKEYCDIRIEELEKQIEELRQIILNINE